MNLLEIQSSYGTGGFFLVPADGRTTGLRQLDGPFLAAAFGSINRSLWAHPEALPALINFSFFSF